MKKENINIPNALSLSRIVFLPLLIALVLLEKNLIFIIIYAIIGATDALDGWVARRFNMTTPIGKSLDSTADLLFYLSTAWFIYVLYPDYLTPNLPLFYVFLGFLTTSLVISTIVYGKPVLMHTIILKLCAALVVSLMVLSYFFDTTWLLRTILIIYLVGISESIIMFIRYGAVDPDTPSIFTLMGHQKEADDMKD